MNTKKFKMNFCPQGVYLDHYRVLSRVLCDEHNFVNQLYPNKNFLKIKLNFKKQPSQSGSFIEEILQSLHPSQNDDGSDAKLKKVDHEFKANLEKENNT